MELLALKQDSDERILNYISRVKAKARQCDLAMPCICGNQWTSKIILHYTCSSPVLTIRKFKKIY